MRIQNHVIANNASIFQHDLVYTKIPIFTILFDLLLGNISGNYIFLGFLVLKGIPPRHFNARRKWIPPAAKHSYAAKAPSDRRPKNHRTLILLFLASSLNPLRWAPVRGRPVGGLWASPGVRIFFVNTRHSRANPCDLHGFFIFENSLERFAFAVLLWPKPWPIREYGAERTGRKIGTAGRPRPKNICTITEKSVI